MTERRIAILNAVTVHPHRGEPSRIELRVIPTWLKGEPVATATLSHNEALRLANQLIQAALVVPE